MIDGICHLWFTQIVDWASLSEAIHHATSRDGISSTLDDEPALAGENATSPSE